MKLKEILETSNFRGDSQMQVPPAQPDYKRDYHFREFENEFMEHVKNHWDLNKKGMPLKTLGYEEDNRVDNLVTAGLIVLKDGRAFLTDKGLEWANTYVDSKNSLTATISIDPGSFNYSTGGNMGP